MNTTTRMREITQAEVSSALQALGLVPGDGLLVHSAIQFLGRPATGVGMYYQALAKVIGLGEMPSASAGTLAVPTFNFAFARGEPFDPQKTPSAGMGVFSEFVRQLEGALRTSHPMQSLAVVGRHAADLTSRDTLSAFDPGSAFERMLELDFKLLLLGADIQAVSMLHYSEQRAGVPYRYWKDFSAPVRTSAGWETHTYRMFVRDLEIDAQIELYPVQEVLVARNAWSAVKVNYGWISTCRLRDFVAVVDEFLRRDPWSLVTNPPQRA